MSDDICGKLVVLAVYLIIGLAAAAVVVYITGVLVYEAEGAVGLGMAAVA